MELKVIFLEIVYLDLYSDKVWGFFHFAHPQAIFTHGRSYSTNAFGAEQMPETNNLNQT